MKAQDLTENESRELDLRLAADNKVGEQIKQEALKCGFTGITVEYDSDSPVNAIYLYHTIAKVEALANLLSRLSKIVSVANMEITIEDSELKIEF